MDLHISQPLEQADGALVDVQALSVAPSFMLNRVGIRSFRYPVQIVTQAGGVQPSVADFSFFVSLSAQSRGTHMSRFVAMIHEHQAPFSLQSHALLLERMLATLEAEAGEIRMSFPYFLEKKAPVSGLKSLMEYMVDYTSSSQHGVLEQSLSVQVPVTSLCPCSKAISDYGAHNQRAHIQVVVPMHPQSPPLWSEDLISLVEAEASCDLFALLKRVDEKYVTEKAYNRAKFVEDVVRDIAARLEKDYQLAHYKVSAENFESIHQHSAYAEIDK